MVGSVMDQGGEGDANQRIDKQQDDADHNQTSAVPHIIQIKRPLKHGNRVFEILGLPAKDVVARRQPRVFYRVLWREQEALT